MLALHALKVIFFSFLKNNIHIMGCCLGCDDPYRNEVTLAEYNPLILGAPVDNYSQSMYTDRMIEYAEKYEQPNLYEMTRDISNVPITILR